MAPSLNILSVLAIALAICVQGTLGEIACEHLDQDTCAYAISSAGKRCVLEKRVKRTGEEAYTCRTSEIEADRLRNWVETDQCIKACGLDRKSLGISTDSLLESSFAQQLCSPQCYDSCPNVVDLYFNLAAAEGVFLPKLCEAQEGNARRGLMARIKSSGFVAPGQVHPVKYTVAPAPIKPVKYTVAPAPVVPVKYTVAPAPYTVAPTPVEPDTVAPAPVEPVKYTVAPAPVEPVKYTVAPAPVEPDTVAPAPVEPVKYTVAPTPYTVAPAPIEPITVAPAPVEPVKYTVAPAMSPY